MTEFQPVEGALYQELLWVHGIIRRDLEVIQRLADEAVAGAPAEVIAAEIANLQTSGPLWRLRVNCMQYCHLVHHHHRLEDVAFFPSLQRLDPELTPVIERLKADHLGVSDLLDAIEKETRQLGKADTPEKRQALSDALQALADKLLAHLSYEEESLQAVLTRTTTADLFG